MKHITSKLCDRNPIFYINFKHACGFTFLYLFSIVDRRRIAVIWPPLLTKKDLRPLFCFFGIVWKKKTKEDWKQNQHNFHTFSVCTQLYFITSILPMERMTENVSVCVCAIHTQTCNSVECFQLPAYVYSSNMSTTFIQTTCQSQARARKDRRTVCSETEWLYYTNHK